MTKTRRKKRLLKMLRKKHRLEEYLKRMGKESRKLGFKAAEEYILWKALRDEGVEASHNVKVCGVEVDLFIKPSLVIEVGFLDNNLRKAWRMLEEKGYGVLYFANLEIRGRKNLRNTVKKIMEALKPESFDRAY